MAGWKKTLPVVLNWALVGFLVAAVAVLVALGELADWVLAVAALILAVGVFLRQRWAYFAGGAWSLACYHLAREELALAFAPRAILLLALILIVLCIYLHETRAHHP